MHIDVTRKVGFEAVSVDTMELLKKILNNNKLCKLLYYNTRDALKKDCLCEEDKSKLVKEGIINIKPYIKSSDYAHSYLMISFGNFSLNESNPKFLDSVLKIDILCHHDIWEVEKNNTVCLRPYLIANELMNEIHEKKFNGIGETYFVTGDLLILGTDADYSGISLVFSCSNFIN